MKVYIGIPFYGGAEAGFVSSLLKSHYALHLAGHTVEVDMHTNCSILPKARNEIVMRFMESGFDRLIFLDTDMVWRVKDLFSLVNSEHDVCGLDYRKKEEKENYVAGLMGREREGWLQASVIGFGVACLSRAAIEVMISVFPGLEYLNEHGEKCYSLFDFMLHNGKYWGEDATFCRRWLETGGDISVLKDAETGHIGTKTYKTGGSTK